MFRMFLIAYLAVPFLAAVSFDGPASLQGATSGCECGECALGCDCCLSEVCGCDVCVCTDCVDTKSLVSAKSEPVSACCAGGACPGMQEAGVSGADVLASTTSVDADDATVVSTCDCTHCEEGGQCGDEAGCACKE